MSLSKNHLTVKLSKKTLSLDEKSKKFLDFAKGNPNFGCRKLAEIFKTGKTAAEIILKGEESIRSQHELFHDKSKKRNRPGKYQKINYILYLWYQKCCGSNIYPNVPMLKEEAMAIKESLQDSNLDQSRASKGILDKWKSDYAIKERRTVSAAEDVAEETITSWMERILQLTEGYSSGNIWNMDESGCFFKALSNKGPVQKGKEAKGGKKIQTKIHHSFVC